MFGRVRQVFSPSSRRQPCLLFRRLPSRQALDLERTRLKGRKPGGLGNPRYSRLGSLRYVVVHVPGREVG